MKSILALLALSTLTPKGPKMTENDSYHARLAIEHASTCVSAPSVLYRPKLSADGTAWCALLGENLQEGVAGFGDTPAEAMTDFDKAFLTERTPNTMLQLSR